MAYTFSRRTEFFSLLYLVCDVRVPGVADMEVISTGSDKSTLNTDTANGSAGSGGAVVSNTLKRTTLSNSLIDMHEAGKGNQYILHSEV